MHKTYDFAFSFADELVREILDSVEAKPNDVVLDPFCGTGTTLLECCTRGINVIGVDANPVCIEVAKTKLDWGVSRSDLKKAKLLVAASFNRRESSFSRWLRNRKKVGRSANAEWYPPFANSEIGNYLIESGMLKRGWIQPRVALRIVFIVDAINNQVSSRRVQRFMRTTLFGILVPAMSNMKYGPELYRARTRREVNVLKCFIDALDKNIEAMAVVRKTFEKSESSKLTILGDSANGALGSIRAKSVSHVITSPPYPNEHEYTRNTRLELAFGGYVSNLEELRAVKSRMLRSTTKSIYANDEREKLIERFPNIRRVRDRIESRAASTTHGFGRLYGKVVGEYFGGMQLVLKQLHRVLKKGGTCSLVVGDQASFFSIKIATPEHLIRIALAKSIGFKLVSRKRLGTLRGTTGKRVRNFEWLITLRKV